MMPPLPLICPMYCPPLPLLPALYPCGCLDTSSSAGGGACHAACAQPSRPADGCTHCPELPSRALGRVSSDRGPGVQGQVWKGAWSKGEAHGPTTAGSPFRGPKGKAPMSPVSGDLLVTSHFSHFSPGDLGDQTFLSFSQLLPPFFQLKRKWGVLENGGK